MSNHKFQLIHCDVGLRQWTPDKWGSTSCRPAAATICPRPSPPPWAPKGPPPPSRRQRSSSFPRSTRSHAYRCSRLTRQRVGDLDLLTLKVVSESRVTWAIPPCQF